MFRYILVPAAGTDIHDAAFRTALVLARGTGGHLAFLHVHLDPQKLLISLAAGDFGGAAGIGEFIDTMQQDIAFRQDHARQAVTAFCAREQLLMTETTPGAAPSASFQVEVGEEAQLLASYARTADLTVLGRARDGETVALDLLEAVLLGSGRPLLIAPARPPEHIGRNIAIAWKDTPEAARAVACAIPLLQSAEAVTIITVTEEEQNRMASGDRLRRALRWHNPATALRIVRAPGKDPGDALLAAVADTGADLLVMGGYSHSRMREVVFGGFTRRVLRAADFPVLMAH